VGNLKMPKLEIVIIHCKFFFGLHVCRDAISLMRMMMKMA
jgi:hypothetical protein